MKSNIGKRLVALCACTVLATGGALAADIVSKNIPVRFAGIKLVLDNAPLTLKKTTGEKIEPFIYDGMVYVPVQPLGEALGKKVAWEGKTRTVYLGEKPGDVKYLTDVCPPYETSYCCTAYKTTDLKSFSMAGVKYTNGITILYRSWATDYALFNLNGQYQSIKMMMGTVDGANGSCSFNFIVDGKPVAEYTLEAGDYPREITIPLNYGLQLKIISKSGSGTVGLGNIVVE